MGGTRRSARNGRRAGTEENDGRQCGQSTPGSRALPRQDGSVIRGLWSPWGPAPSTAGPGLRARRRYEVAAKHTGGLPPPPRRAHAVVSSPLSPDIWSRGSVCCALRAHAAYELPRTSHSVSHFAFAFLAGAPARPTMLAARKAPGLTGVEGSLSPLCVHRPPSSGQPHTPAWSCPDPAVLPLLPHNVKCTGTGSRQVWL